MTFDELIEKVGNLFIRPYAVNERRKSYPVLTEAQQELRQRKEVPEEREKVEWRLEQQVNPNPHSRKERDDS